MPGLQFAVMKAGFTNVKCICRDRDGFPDAGQTLVLCENCGVWVHQPCIIGLVLPRLPKTGYHCAACVKAQRYEIGRKGVETKKRNLAKLRGEAGYLDGDDDSPVPTKKTKEVGWIRQYPLGDPNIQVQDGWVRQYPINPNNPHGAQLQPKQTMALKHGQQGTSSASTSKGSLRQIRKAREEYQNTMTQLGALTETNSDVQDNDFENNQADENTAVPDALDREKAILYVRHKLLKGLLAREKAPEESDMVDINDMIIQLEKYDRDGYLASDVLLSTKIHRVIKAIAQLQDLPVHKNSDLQERCTALWETWNQRLEAVQTFTDNEPKPQTPPTVNDPKPQTPPSDEVLCDCPEQAFVPASDTFRCVVCRHKQHKGCIRVAGRKTRKSLVLCNGCRAARTEKQLLRTQITTFNILQEQEDEALRTYCGTILWKMYCDLPCGEGCSDNLRELTHMEYNGGDPIPKHPAPAEWVEEITKCIQTMVTVGGDKMNELLGPNSGETKFDTPFAPALRDMALWMIRDGPFKFQKHKLGVLSEVLGLETKGSIWKV